MLTKVQFTKVEKGLDSFAKSKAIAVQKGNNDYVLATGGCECPVEVPNGQCFESSSCS